MYTTEKITPDSFVPQRFESDGTITLHGTEIPYHTVSEDNVFYDQAGKAIASIFSYSYFRSDAENPAERPVLFCYNGGPGSSSMYVHAGFLAPVRLLYEQTDRPTALPPYKMIDNPDWLLDVADIVLVDPVATGYGLLIDESRAGDFLGIEQDAEALLVFIEAWLNRYRRWNSPKYLIGESYGCTRSAVAAGIACIGSKTRSYSIGFDGIVMIGNTVTTGKYFGVDIHTEPAVLYFPTWAAINWYHNHPTEQPLEEFVAEAQAFADHDYLLALYAGEDLDAEKKEEILQKAMYYTGVSRQYLLDRNLVIDDETFRIEVIREKGATVARYDGRITRPRYVPEALERSRTGLEDDASDDRYGAYFYAAVTGTILPKLNVKLDRPYVAMYNCWEGESKAHQWDRKETLGTTGEQLRNAMYRTPGMRTFFANGWYDDCTYIGIVHYTLRHAGLPRDRVCVKGYPSGHMIYIGEDNVKTLCDDIRSFIAGGMPSNG